MNVSAGATRIGLMSKTAALLVILLAGMEGRGPSAPAAPDAQRSNLRLLYAGRPGSDRERDFVAFLRKYFAIVRTGNLETFQESDTQGFDVTLLDWDWNDLQGPKPTVSEGFSRPVVTLGVAGGLICRRWRLKTGYL
jgi:hypothetical protein